MTDFDPIAEFDPSRPNCVAAQAALQRLLDREADWDTPEAAAHRAGCAECRDELMLARSMSRVVTAVVVPSELSARVLNASVAAHRSRQRIRWAGAAFAVAASVVIAVIALRPGPGPGPAPNPTPNPNVSPDPTPVVLISPRKPDDPSAVAREKPLGESVSEAADAIVSLTRRTASEPKERITVLLPQPRLLGADEPDERLDPLADAGTGAARSVEPLKDSARRALNFFVRAADPPARQ